MDSVRELACRIPGWSANDDFSIERIAGGYTNENYILTKGGERYVLRVSGRNTDDLGIDRDGEAEVYRAVSNACIAPELIAYIEPEGHLVTRFVVGSPWDFPDFKRHDVRTQVVSMLKTAHSITGVSCAFDPYYDIHHRIAVCNAHDVTLPSNIGSHLSKLEAVKSRLDEGFSARVGLCHNDPFPNNFLHNGSTWLLDWEFGGMGDTMWDLACVTMGVDDLEKADFLRLYFGAYSDDYLELLEDSRYVVRLWNALWALLQSFLSPIDHDFAEWSERMFSSLEST